MGFSPFVSIPALCAVIAAIVLASIPSKIDPAPYELPPPRTWDGPLSFNSELLKAEKLFAGEIVGPESMVHRDGVLYTGTGDGKLLKINIDKNEFSVLTTFGKPPCGAYEHEHTCGRPLGMRFDKNGNLIVIDTYLGLYSVNVDNGHYKQLFPSTIRVANRPVHFLNDLDIASDGRMYMTDSSRFQRRDFPLDLLEGRGHGRLIEYDPRTNQTKELLSGLFFANGVQLSPKEDYVLVAETTRFQIKKYFLAGPKQGKSEIFIDNLPMSPDNIRRSTSGGFWVTGALCRGDHTRIDLIGFLQANTILRSLLSKLPVRLMHQAVIPCGMVIELNQDGKIIRSLQDRRGENLAFLSEIEDIGGTLYLGSFRAPHLGKIKLQE